LPTRAGGDGRVAEAGYEAAFEGSIESERGV